MASSKRQLPSSTTGLPDLVQWLQRSYWTTTPQSLKLIDAYIAFTVVVGVLQFVYCLLVSSFPYNAFLAGFGSAVASFTFATVLRIRVNPKNTEYAHLSPERAFAEFVVCHVVLHFIVANYLG
ncbi:Dolichyl-diphosphooligosaccharide-protein glycosyltransferase subunit dad1 [Dimargaris verticillata]|uniref:Dolichyl-diphosphooligosaccharide--protein glycosyltransferase subunit OST2 n=1 Tax=Dimargaris verticillata TaxID=2761393 RepID=A0A9W8AY03_9FUNG|nr:Dolichyl-diphosphooligosaccharide-protein glycosyltransferase subunit dad1 [Dimargaris verticillata]